VGVRFLGRLEDHRRGAIQTRVGDKRCLGPNHRNDRRTDGAKLQTRKESITHRRSRGQSRWIQLEGDRGIGRQRHAKEGTYRCRSGRVVMGKVDGRWGGGGSSGLVTQRGEQEEHILRYNIDNT
jgi:hypothetical protein